MPSRRIIGIGVASAAVAIAGWAGLATATASDTGPGDGTTRGGTTLRFQSVEVDMTEIDLGDPGFSPGDQIVFADNLRRDDRKIGTDAGVCTVVRVTGDPEYSCDVTYRLPRGAITGHTLLRASELPAVHFAITGGTDAFAEVGGQGHSRLRHTAGVVLHVEQL